METEFCHQTDKRPCVTESDCGFSSKGWKHLIQFPSKWMEGICNVLDVKILSYFVNEDPELEVIGSTFSSDVCVLSMFCEDTFPRDVDIPSIVDLLRWISTMTDHFGSAMYEVTEMGCCQRLKNLSRLVSSRKRRACPSRKSIINEYKAFWIEEMAPCELLCHYFRLERRKTFDWEPYLMWTLSDNTDGNTTLIMLRRAKGIALNDGGSVWFW